jgi:hypothetical protein
MDYIWLLPTLQFVAGDNNFSIRNSDKILSLSNEYSPLIDFLLELDGNSTESELESKPAYSILKPFLTEMGWIVRLRKPLKFYMERFPLVTRQISYFAHFTQLYPDRIVEYLSEKKIAVLGLGGIGSLVAHNLLGSGVKNLHLYDFDRVELSNLNRQMLYFPSDIGELKSVALKNILEEKFVDANIESSEVNFDVSIPDLSGFDLVVICGECAGLYQNPEKLDHINIIRAGYAGRIGQIGPLVRKEFPITWSDLIQNRTLDKQLNSFENPIKRPNSWSPSGATINTTIAGMLSEECLRFLCPELGPTVSDLRCLSFDMQNFDLTKLSVELSL